MLANGSGGKIVLHFTVTEDITVSLSRCSATGMSLISNHFMQVDCHTIALCCL